MFDVCFFAFIAQLNFFWHRQRRKHAKDSFSLETAQLLRSALPSCPEKMTARDIATVVTSSYLSFHLTFSTGPPDSPAMTCFEPRVIFYIKITIQLGYTGIKRQILPGYLPPLVLLFLPFLSFHGQWHRRYFLLCHQQPHLLLLLLLRRRHQDFLG